MNKIKIVMPSGALGKVDDEPELDTLLRKIAEKYSTNPNDWAEKYGIDFENDEFMMHRYCWCEKKDCNWCNGKAPNFKHKATGFEVKWYKYIGRDMEMNRKSPLKELKKLLI